MNEPETTPLIPRLINMSSVRVVIPLSVVRANDYKPGDLLAVRISSDTPGVDYVEFTATVRKYGIQYMFTIPATVWPFVCNLGYDTGEAVPMELSRPSP